MKKRLLVLAALAGMCFTAHADEGMWLLPYLQKMNIEKMHEYGLQLSAEEIYSADKPSLKDNIVIFGRGCTGEIVSKQGLLFTNHHCGYPSIQALSSVEHDYLLNGFWAKSQKEELPCPGLEVRFIRHILDLTEDVLGNIPSTMQGEEYQKMVDKNLASIKKELTKKYAKDNEGVEIRIAPFYGGNEYFAFVMDVYSDIRMVAAPPSSLGKFGGDTDNWMWPRHTADFSVFRVYADENNRPAAYSTKNRPYEASSPLKVSLDGYDEGDYAMVMGFPGSTRRYMTSFEVDRMLDIENPQRIFIRGERQAILKEDMAASDKVRIQYASKYAQSSNYWKNSIGKSKGLKKLKVRERKAEEEAKFRAWADAESLPEEGFQTALDLIEQSCEESNEAFAALEYLDEALLRAVELISPARMVLQYVEKKGKMSEEAMEKRLSNFYKDFNLSTDRKVAKRMLQITKENCHRLPDFYSSLVEKKFGGNIEKYVDNLYAHSVFTTEKGAVEALSLNAKRLAEDPAIVLAKSVMAKVKELQQEMKSSKEKYVDGHRLYIRGLMAMNPEKAWASDANFTIRLTYGRILPYSPADGIHYNYYTTLKGVMEKEDKSNPVEFTVPEYLKELHERRDYGRYANASGVLPVAFLADCDITGGNSGSPVLNHDGALIGLAFDGNWEAMSGDEAFEPDLQRMISVDIRYVLFLIDKFGGAGWLLDELEIK